MHLAFYDLLGALFAPSEPTQLSHYTEKLFKRIFDIIKEHFANPDLGPSEVAAKAGISLRYLQKLFAAQGSTCSRFIYSVRLDHAARLLRRRSLLDINEPISAIAYASGFVDYATFARQFRRRFGHSPGARAAYPITPERGVEKVSLPHAH
jgi:AraC-like DNA-binding protein